MNMNKIILRYQYLINDIYNAYFRWSRSIVDNESVPASELATTSPYLYDARPFATVWLRNIDRLIRTAGIEPEKFEFVDVGCGKGVSTLYAQDKFRFSRVSGFDFDQGLVSIAKANRDGSSVRKREAITFFAGDAAQIKLPATRSFCFLFNSFGADVLRLFLANNLDMLRETRSVIGYANCHELHVFDEIKDVTVRRVKWHRCATISF